MYKFKTKQNLITQSRKTPFSSNESFDSAYAEQKSAASGVLSKQEMISF